VAESYLSFEFGGVGHVSFLDTTATSRWATFRSALRASAWAPASSTIPNLRQRLHAAGARHWEAADRARTLLRRRLLLRARLGIHTASDLSRPDPRRDFSRLPPEVKIDKPVAGVRFDVDSVTARKLLEARLAQLLEAYPQVDYVWLWEDEEMNWQSRKTESRFR
jgi:hypothetical protein